MAKADMDKTSFNGKPKEGAEVIDVYGGGSLSDLLKTSDLKAALTSLESVFSDVTPDVVAKQVKSPKVQAKVNAGGGSTKKFIDGLITKTPGNLTLKNQTKTQDLADIDNILDRVNETLSPEQKNMSQQTFDTMLQYAPFMTNAMNEDGTYFCQKNSANNLSMMGKGAGGSDSAMLLSYFLGLLNDAIGCDKNFDLLAAIKDIDAPSSVLSLMTGIMIGESAKKGDDVRVLQLASDSLNQLNNNQRREAASNLAKNYKWAPRTSPDKKASAERLSNSMAVVYPAWRLGDRNGTEIIRNDIGREASADFKELYSMTTQGQSYIAAANSSGSFTKRGGQSDSVTKPPTVEELMGNQYPALV